MRAAVWDDFMSHWAWDNLPPMPPPQLCREAGEGSTETDASGSNYLFTVKLARRNLLNSGHAAGASRRLEPRIAARHSPAGAGRLSLQAPCWGYPRISSAAGDKLVGAELASRVKSPAGGAGLTMTD